MVYFETTKLFLENLCIYHARTFLIKFIKRLRVRLCDNNTYMQKIGINQSFAQRKVLSFDKICFCVPAQRNNVKKKARKVCRVEKNTVPLPTLS